MNRHFTTKIRQSKNKKTIEDYPIKTQLEMIMAKFEDPLSEVISILDPFHSKIVRPEVKPNHDIPENPNYGLFRVIYWVRDDSGTKFHTVIVKAKDGHDAAGNIEGEFIEYYKSNLMKVVGVECVIIPKKYIWKLNEEFPIAERKELVKTQVELEKADIIRRLEIFEDEKPAPDLSNFLNDEQSEFDK